jgi:hypothetical protein
MQFSSRSATANEFLNNRALEGDLRVDGGRKKKFLYLFLGSWLVYLAFLAPGIYSVDGLTMLAVADSLVTHHNVDVPPELGIPGRNGLSYSMLYPLQSAVAVPIVAVAVKASGVVHLPVRYVESLAVTILPALYTALTVGVVYLLAIALESSEAGAWLAAVTYGFGTIALAYTRDFYADPQLALLMALGLLLAFTRPPSWQILAVAALAILAKPTGIILGPILSLYLFWRTRRFWQSLLPGLGTALGLAVYSIYNVYRFGKLTAFGNQWAFSFKFVPRGFLGLLISPGMGLLWYCPCVILSAIAFRQIKTKRLEAWTIAALAAASVLLHSLWISWNGGWSWGPRLLLPVLPGLVALTGVLVNEWRKLLVVSAVLGFLISAPNLVSFFTRYLTEANEQGVPFSDVLWKPSRSPLLHAWPAAYRQIEDARSSDVRDLFAQRTEVRASKMSNSRALRIVAVWWWLLPVAHVSRLWGLLVAVLLTACGIRLLFLARAPGFRPIRG